MINGIGNSSYAAMAYSGMRGGPGQPDAAKMQERMFQAVDANEDGSVDKTELAAYLEESAGLDSDTAAIRADEILADMDADSNGNISQQEATDAARKLLDELQSQFMGSFLGGAGGPPGVEERFGEMDSNGDGQLDTDEITAALANGPQGARAEGPGAEDILARDDTDGDGQISLSEFTRATENRPGMALPPPPSSSSGDTEDLFGQMDSDGDGQVSLDEFRTALEGNGDNASDSENTLLDALMSAALKQYRNASQGSTLPQGRLLDALA